MDSPKNPEKWGQTGQKTALHLCTGREMRMTGGAGETRDSRMAGKKTIRNGMVQIIGQQ